MYASQVKEPSNPPWKTGVIVILELLVLDVCPWLVNESFGACTYELSS